MSEIHDAYTAIFVEDSGTGVRQPQNIAALVESYIEPVEASQDEPMRAFNLRLPDHDRARLRVLADVLGTSKTGIARELLHQSLNEAFQCLPQDRKPSLDDLDAAIAAERGAGS